MSGTFDPSNPAQPRFDRYGPARLPSPLDDEVQGFIDRLRSEGAAAVADATSHASERGRRVLRAYAERMASLAVRRSDPTLLVAALIAAVVGGLYRNEREALLVMPLIEASARQLRTEVDALFEEAAGVVGHPGSVNLMLWLARPPERREISVMGFAIGADDDGFRYRWVG